MPCLYKVFLLLFLSPARFQSQPLFLFLAFASLDFASARQPGSVIIDLVFFRQGFASLAWIADGIVSLVLPYQALHPPPVSP